MDIIRDVKLINFKNKTKSKKVLIDDFSNILMNIDKNINLSKYDANINDDKIFIDKFVNFKIIPEAFRYYKKDYIFTILKFTENDKKLYFILRDDEKNGYFKKYLQTETSETIANLNLIDIVSKLAKFDFLVVNNNNNNNYYITLLHLDNDFTINQDIEKSNKNKTKSKQN